MKISEHIKFSITMAIVPWIPAFILYRHSQIKIALILLCTFIFVSLVCFINKSFALNLKRILTKTGNIIGRYLAIIVLFIGYFIAVLPTGILMKAVKRDRLKLKKQNVNSYWINYENNSTDYEYQF